MLPTAAVKNATKAAAVRISWRHRTEPNRGESKRNKSFPHFVLGFAQMCCDAVVHRLVHVWARPKKTRHYILSESLADM